MNNPLDAIELWIKEKWGDLEVERKHDDQIMVRMWVVSRRDSRKTAVGVANIDHQVYDGDFAHVSPYGKIYFSCHKIVPRILSHQISNPNFFDWLEKEINDFREFHAGFKEV